LNQVTMKTVKKTAEGLFVVVVTLDCKEGKRVLVSENITFVSLMAAIARLFESELVETFILSYSDEDGDRVKVESDEELTEALVALKNARKKKDQNKIEKKEEKEWLKKEKKARKMIKKEVKQKMKAEKQRMKKENKDECKLMKKGAKQKMKAEVKEVSKQLKKVKKQTMKNEKKEEKRRLKKEAKQMLKEEKKEVKHLLKQEVKRLKKEKKIMQEEDEATLILGEKKAQNQRTKKEKKKVKQQTKLRLKKEKRSKKKMMKKEAKQKQKKEKKEKKAKKKMMKKEEKQRMKQEKKKVKKAAKVIKKQLKIEEKKAKNMGTRGDVLAARADALQQQIEKLQMVKAIWESQRKEIENQPSKDVVNTNAEKYVMKQGFAATATTPTAQVHIKRLEQKRCRLQDKLQHVARKEACPKKAKKEQKLKGRLVIVSAQLESVKGLWSCVDTCVSSEVMSLQQRRQALLGQLEEVNMRIENMGHLEKMGCA